MPRYDYKTQDVMAMLSKSVESKSDEVDALTEYIFEICREDSFRHEKLLGTVEDRPALHEKLEKMLTNVENPALADRLASLATGFIAHDAKYRNPSAVERLAIFLIDRKTTCTNSGVLTATANLLKVPKFRAHLWNISGVHVLIRASLSASKSDAVTQYQAVMCTWLLSFNQKFIPHLVESGIFVKLIQLMKHTPRKEKLVRLGLEIIANSLDDKDALEVMLDEKVGDSLDIFVFEKWRSEDLYERINEISDMFHKKVREWSTYERYMKELDTGRLKPGYLHEDEFWAENVMEFEDKEFLPIRKLITLLRSSDVSTLALACHDLGEFARLHPTGKQVLHKLHARDMLLALMNHKDREVERESLLTIQKLMLDNWQAASEPTR